MSNLGHEWSDDLFSQRYCTRCGVRYADWALCRLLEVCPGSVLNYFDWTEGPGRGFVRFVSSAPCELGWWWEFGCFSNVSRLTVTFKLPHDLSKMVIRYEVSHG